MGLPIPNSRHGYGFPIDIFGMSKKSNKHFFIDRRDGVVVRASSSQSVDLGFIPLVESYQKL